MLEGLYSAAAGMTAQQQRMDTLSNDVANVNTTGYKRVRTGFRDLLYSPAGQGAARPVSAGAGARAWAMGRGFAQGSLQNTDRPLDVALTGPGFLQVRRPDGTQGLTRNGAMAFDARGRLTSAGTGDLIAPPITLPRGVEAKDVQIEPDGSVRAGRRQIGRLEVVDVPSPENLADAGDSVYTATAGSGAPRATGTRLQSGTLEASNVDMADAMVDLMDAQRSYQLASSAIRTQDQMLEIANGVKR